MSSERRAGRSTTPLGAADAAIQAGNRTCELVSGDPESSYLANDERQLAVERLLIRFGEALKDIPNDVLLQVDPTANWIGPKGFRDLERVPISGNRLSEPNTLYSF